MTDEEYIFNETSKERKRVGKGAYARKCGSRSKRYSLPSDNLTAKERKELNGKVEVIKMGKPMTYEEWRNLSLTLKKLYIEELFIKRHARIRDVATMFGKDENNIRRAMMQYGIDLKELSKKSKQFKKREPSEEWIAFLRGPSEEEAQEVPEPAEEPIVAQEPSQCVKQAPESDAGARVLTETDINVVSGSLNYIGDPALIFSKAMMALDPSKSYHIQIRFKEA